ncbi:hypothetical protein [Streptomyces camelliae]|uniref:Uncharacterized protein n=1 Tax=Streptomyces camelliae TaxID=3004093 RepID=A0ABY7NZM1_9ACTN|nr:hypothetical protein [Streptomyces sp. HUAS 2-6]WBO63696.1 hypothetical protein O1G22_13090 [Streptomyces sp. HUAS 2-6]
MIEIEYQKMHTAQLLREAEQERLARTVTRGRRAARRAEPAGHDSTGADSHTDRPRRQRLPRTA